MASVDAVLDVRGDGWALPRTRRLARKLSIDKRVEFHGWATQTELDRAYEASSVVAVPSHWPEPFGLVGIEAMAHGRPVVASATGGIPEWLHDGESGLLVEPGNPRALAEALMTVLSDRGLAQRLGEAGATRVRSRFSEHAYLEAIADVYKQAEANWNGVENAGPQWRTLDRP